MVGLIDRKLLICASKIFSNIYLNQYLHPSKTSKIFSVYVAVGETNYDEYIKVCSRNCYYATFYYENSPDTEKFLSDIVNVISTYSPTVEQKSATVVVFDLDDTIITPEYKLFYNEILLDLEQFREIFDYIVLWTHGTEDYLARRMRDINFNFDIMMSRKRDIDDPPQMNKGLSAVLRCLNEKYNVKTIKYAVLVDDKLENYNQDYDFMLLIDKKPLSRFYKSALEVIRSALISNKRCIIPASEIQ